MTECSKPGCYPEETGCMAFSGNKPFHECKHWKVANKDAAKTNPEVIESSKQGYRVAWTSNSFGKNDLNLVFEKSSNATIIGLIGASDSGKTTYLSLLYLMLISSEVIPNWQFAYSYTLRGWENISNNLEWSSGNKYNFPPHTSVNEGRVAGLLHLAFRIDGQVKDFIFTDVSGEWFTQWAKDKNSNEGAEWIYNHADSFIFLIDCEKLKDIQTIPEGRRETLDIGSRLKDNLNNRPIATLWAKSDYKEDVNPKVVETIEKELNNKFQDNHQYFEISYFPKSGKDDTRRDNILNALSWIHQQLSVNHCETISIPKIETNDLFLSFRGH